MELSWIRIDTTVLENVIVDCFTLLHVLLHVTTTINIATTASRGCLGNYESIQ